MNACLESVACQGVRAVDRETFMVHPVPRRRTIHPMARPATLPSFSMAALGYLAMAIAVVSVGILTAIL